MAELNTSNKTEHERKKRRMTMSHKLAVRATRYAMNVFAAYSYGRDASVILPGMVVGLCEDSIVSSRLCHPSEETESLLYRQAHAGNWLAHDFRRSEFYPEAAEYKDFPLNPEGFISAFIPEDIGQKPNDEPTRLSFAEWMSPDNVLNFDKPGIEKLLDLGMVARRSHEEAYEIAGAEEWIDDLRRRSVADDPVYQVTPKAHTLILVLDEGGKATPKRQTQLSPAKMPGVFAH